MCPFGGGGAGSTIHQRYRQDRQTVVWYHSANRFTDGRPKKWKFSTFHCRLHLGLNIWMICGCDLDPWIFCCSCASASYLMNNAVFIFLLILYILTKENRILLPCNYMYTLWSCICSCITLTVVPKWLYMALQKQHCTVALFGHKDSNKIWMRAQNAGD